MGSARVLLIFFLATLACCWIRANAADSLAIDVSDVSISVLDSDGGVDSQEKLNFEQKIPVELAANHLQKLKLSFKLTTPDGEPFTAHQAFLRLQHDKQQHLFIFKSTKKGYVCLLDFLGLAETLHYISGEYTLELLVGDAKMANSFLWKLGTLQLELPEAPENAGKKLPATAPELSTRYGPKPEISHIFRAPEKRPPVAVSYTFLALTLLPLLGFLVGLKLLKVNVESLPKSGAPALFAFSFHGLLLAILGLYLLFWLKFNLFFTLRVLGFLGLLTTVAGYKLLYHLADASSKVKVA